MTNLTIALTIAPDGDGDNYYANRAAAHGNGSRVLYHGSDWKHAIYEATGFARLFSINVILNGNRIFEPDTLDEAVNTSKDGRDGFFHIHLEHGVWGVSYNGCPGEWAVAAANFVIDYLRPRWES